MGNYHQMHQSIIYKTGKNKISPQVVTTILHNDCVSPHNGNTITVAEKIISVSNNTNEYDETRVLIAIDHENLQRSELYSNTSSYLGKLNYCVRTELYLLEENAIKDISVSFVNTKFSTSFDLLSMSNEL